MEVQLEGRSVADLEVMAVQAQLYRLDESGQAQGAPVLDMASEPVPLWAARDAAGVARAADAPAGAVARLSTDVLSLPGGPPALWSAERPHLYLLLLALVGKDGAAVEYEACQVGFRHAEVTGRQLLHNGRAIMVKGEARGALQDWGLPVCFVGGVPSSLEAGSFPGEHLIHCCSVADCLFNLSIPPATLPPQA